MPNRLFYTVKLTSSLLKEYKYNMNVSFEDCAKSGLIVSLSDSQMLTSIRDITGKVIDRDKLEEWYRERDQLKKRKSTKENKDRIKQLQKNIYDMMYIPEYITVTMESKKDYERMFLKGFVFNGRTYRRMSCSASQARVSTIVFVDETIKEELKRRLDNGRDLNHLLAKSKYSAYLGLYSSAIKKVSAPRYCIVPDCEKVLDVDVNYVIEKDRDTDDVIEQRTIQNKFNLFDGSGLISPKQAERWGRDLGEDYTPCNFCLRYSFTKGMVNEFDFVKWCEEYNDGNYFIKDIYGNLVDLREIDVILSEGQVKLWDSWESQESLEENSKKNGIIWGITKYAPKQDKKVLTTNYQYLQTLNLTDDMIKDVCQDTVDYIQGVTYDNIYYTLLYLMGEMSSAEDVDKFLNVSDNYWLKCLILDHNIFNDKYSKEKVKDMIITRIEQACLGRLIVQGNYQCIVPDSFAYMEWICYRDVSRVKGLLGPGEAYVDYWNRNGLKDGDKIDAMRSPLTHTSEHGIDTVRNTELMRKWYSYSYSGYICNVHDEFTMIHAGSDFDYDIVSSTDNINFVNGKFPNQRVVTYDVKKPKKAPFTEYDLFVADTFSFGTQIGQITNTCSSICALLALYPEGTREHTVLADRLAAGCAAQSRQIDKTKIGESVKTMATVCTQFQRSSIDDTPEQRADKEFYNSILADKKPYFFKYKYPALNKELSEYDKKSDANSILRFGKSLATILEQEKDREEYNKLTEDEKTFLQFYHKLYPVIDSDCVMNKICKYIESVEFNIKQKIRSSASFDYKSLMSDPGFNVNTKIFVELSEELSKCFDDWKSKKKVEYSTNSAYISPEAKANRYKFDKEVEYSMLRDKLIQVCSNEEQLVNHLIYIFYVTKPSYSKSVLWSLFGKQIYSNVRSRVNTIYFPVKNELGSFKFLYDSYSIEYIKLADIEKKSCEKESYENGSYENESVEDGNGEFSDEFMENLMNKALKQSGN